MKRRLAATCLVAVMALTAGAPAQASAELRWTSPADGAVQEGPLPDIVFTFDGDLVPGQTGVVVTTETGEVVPTSPPRFPGTRRAFFILLPEAIAPGAYRVKWNAVAVDETSIAGEFEFTLAP